MDKPEGPSDEASRPDRSIGLSLDLLVLQATVFLFCSIQVEHALERIATIAFIAYWSGVALIARRRPRGVSRSDRQFVRFGWAVLLFYTAVAAQIYWRRAGVI